MGELIDHRRLGLRIVVFYLAALGLSWGYWLALIARGEVVSPVSGATHLPGLAGPLFAAILTTAIFDGRHGLVDLARRCFRLPRRSGLALVLIALPPSVLGLCVLVAWLFGIPLPPLESFLDYPGIAPGLSGGLVVLLAVLFNGLGEEAGWRGFAFHHLCSGMAPFHATLVVAGLWLIWHLPLFLLQQAMMDMVGPPLVGWSLGLFSGAFVLSWLYLAFDRSVLVVALWHVAYNFSVATTAGGEYGAAIVSALVMIGGVVAAWRLHKRLDFGERAAITGAARDRGRASTEEGSP